MKPKIIVILGPTGSGKTQLAIALAKKHHGVVISADSRQVYAGLNIGTAKPREAWRDEPHAVTTPDVVASVPHYFLNIQSAEGAYTVAEWQRDAEQLIALLLEQQQQPIIAGGTMLYLDSLTKNYTIPPIEPNEDLRRQWEKRSTEQLYQELIERDPKAELFVESHNRRRIVRALEVMTMTGRPFSTLRNNQAPRYDYQLVGLFPGWEALTHTIQQRAQQMIDDGLIEETRRLEERYGRELPLLQTINYAQAQKVLRSEYSAVDAVTAMVQATRRYAHRQMSWWKHNDAIRWFSDTGEILNLK